MIIILLDRPVGRYQILGGHALNETQTLGGHVPLFSPCSFGAGYLIKVLINTCMLEYREWIFLYVITL